MSTLKVANVHFESTGANRIDYLNDSIIRFTAPLGILFSSANVLVGRETDSTIGNGVKLDVGGGINTSSIFVTNNVAFDSSSFTKVSKPIANTITITTSNSEKVRVDLSGNVGIGTTSPTYKLEVNGSLAAQTKSFVINHPSKPEMKLQYASLEGPENGVYIRGKCEEHTINLPDYWKDLVDEKTITVNLTPYGKIQSLYVKKIEDNIVHIANKGKTPPKCYYVIYGERKDVAKLIVEY